MAPWQHLPRWSFIQMAPPEPSLWPVTGRALTGGHLPPGLQCFFLWCIMLTFRVELHRNVSKCGAAFGSGDRFGGGPWKTEVQGQPGLLENLSQKKNKVRCGCLCAPAKNIKSTTHNCSRNSERPAALSIRGSLPCLS